MRKFFSPGGLSGPRLALLFTLALLLMLTFALPAQAASVSGLAVEPVNPTIYVQSDYNVTFQAPSGLTVSDVVYINFDYAFDLANVDLNSVGVSVGGPVYTAANVFKNGQTLEVIVPSGISAGPTDKVNITVKGVKNPTSAGNYYWVYVYTNKDSSSPYVNVSIQNPKLAGKLIDSTVEVNQRAKITISLLDQKDQPFIAPFNVGVNLNSSGWGQFYPAPADESQIWSVTIPGGSSSVDVYYRPRAVGDHDISVYTYSFGYIPASVGTLKATPAPQVEAGLYLETPAFTAGKPGQVGVSMRDQYGNIVTQQADLLVKLKAITRTWNPESGQWQEGTMPFYAADADGSPTDTVIDHVYIPAGKDKAVFYYKDTKATNAGDYQVKFVTVASNLEQVWAVEIKPAPSAKVVVEPAAGSVRPANEPFTLAVLLVDQFGNLADPQPPSLTVDLLTDSPTGRFYSSLPPGVNNRISQVTFSEGWYYDYYYGSNDDKKIVYYLDSAPGSPTVFGKASYLETGSVPLKVLPLPATVTLEAVETSWPVNHRGELTLSLKKADGTPYVVPAELEYGLPVLLQTDRPGEFYDALVDGNSSGGSPVIYVPAGQSSIKVYYRPFPEGEHNLKAFIARVDTQGLHEEVPAGAATITAAPAAGVCAAFDQLPVFIAGRAAPVVITVRDQYGNPVKQAADLQVDLDTKTQVLDDNRNWIDQGLSATGAFYANADADGKPVGGPITQVTIPNGSVSAVVYYYDTKATNDCPDYPSLGYRLYLGTKAKEVNGCLVPATVKPAAAQAIKMVVGNWSKYVNLKIANGGMELLGSGGEQHQLLVGANYPLWVAIQDKFGNPAPQSTTVTVDLSAPGIYGKFYQFSDYQEPKLYRTNPLTQLTFDPGQSILKVSFTADGAGTGTIHAKSEGLLEGTYDVTVLTPDRLAIHFPLIGQWDEKLQKLVEMEDNKIQPEQRIPVGIFFVDAAGHPAVTAGDIQVSLNGGSGAFYEHDQSGVPITSTVIPKGYHGVVVWYQAPDAEGEVSLTAAATGLTEGKAAIMVGLKPFWRHCLSRGWNTLSTPFKLERPALEQVIKDANYVEIAYAYDEVNAKWIQIYKDAGGVWRVNKDGTGGATNPEFKFEPLEAIYVKLKGATLAEYYPLRSPSGPYERVLKAGWNLVGAALDLGAGHYGLPADQVLASIKGSYSQAISPGLGCQEAWVYVPDSSCCYPPCMLAGSGYWVYMTKDGRLSGLSYTPARSSHYGYGGGV
ncbi:MAG: hypothetical protein AB1652_01750 [Bacillota bacterium]